MSRHEIDGCDVPWQEVLDNQGIEVIIEALVRHQHEATLQREGCRALEVISTPIHFEVKRGFTF